MSVRPLHVSYAALVAVFAGTAWLLAFGRRPDEDATAALDTWRLAAWLIAMAALIVYLAVWGRRSKGTVFAAIIDRRNRMSLSRAQVLAWTLLVLPTLWIALVNNALRAPASNLLAPLDVDWTLVALMGISVGSFLTAPLALRVKADNEPDPAEVRNARSLGNTAVEGQLVKRTDPASARVADLFMGEETGNFETLDLPRLQMALITAIVWAIYAVMVARSFAMLDHGSWLLTALPRFDNSLLVLVLVSHGGYVTGKLSPHSATTGTVAAQLTAGTTQLLHRIDSLSERIGRIRANEAVSPSVLQQLARIDAQLGRLRTEADGILGRIGSDGASSERIATMRGELDALESVTQSLTQQLVPDPDEIPTPVVHKLIARLNESGFGPIPVSDAWSAACEKALQRFLVGIGLQRTDLDKKPFVAAQEALSLLEEYSSQRRSA